MSLLSRRSVATDNYRSRITGKIDYDKIGRIKMFGIHHVSWKNSKVYQGQRSKVGVIGTPVLGTL